MSAIPEGRELRTRLRGLGASQKQRIARLVSNGGRAESPEEALLVAAVARDSLRRWPWILGLAVVAIGINLASIGFSVARGGSVRPIDVIPLALFAFLIGWHVLRTRPRMREAERVNLELLERP